MFTCRGVTEPSPTEYKADSARLSFKGVGLSLFTSLFTS